MTTRSRAGFVAALAVGMAALAPVSAAQAAEPTTTVYRFFGEVRTDDGFVVNQHYYSTDPNPPAGFVAETPGGAFALGAAEGYGDRLMERCTLGSNRGSSAQQAGYCISGQAAPLGYIAYIPRAPLTENLYRLGSPTTCAPEQRVDTGEGFTTEQLCAPTDIVLTTSAAEAQALLDAGWGCSWGDDFRTVPYCTEGYAAQVS